jgi:hypothetical protein
MNSPEFRSFYFLPDEDVESWKSFTEFHVMNEIEKWRERDGHTCDTCGSSFVEVLDIEVDSYPLYNFDRLAEECMPVFNELFMIDVIKRNGEINLTTGGISRPMRELVVFCLKTMIEYVDEHLPDSYFKEHHRGRFFMCFIGSQSKQGLRLIPQKFILHGLACDEIVSILNEYKKRL